VSVTTDEERIRLVMREMLAADPGSAAFTEPSDIRKGGGWRWHLRIDVKLVAAVAAAAILVATLVLAGPLRPGQNKRRVAVTIPTATSTTAHPSSSLPVATTVPGRTITTTTTTPQQTLPPAPTTTTSNPATPLTAVSTPRTGSVGTTTINATATLAGIPTGLTGYIEFDVHLGTGTQGQPAYSTSTPFDGPGTYPMPNGFVPTTHGTYYVSAFTTNTSDSSSFQVSPFGNPDLTTTISG